MANQKQELPVAAMFVNGSEQNVQSLERTFYRCFLPSFNSFGWGVSEEKIKMWKVNGRRTPKWWQKLTLPLARWAKNWSYTLVIACCGWPNFKTLQPEVTTLAGLSIRGGTRYFYPPPDFKECCIRKFMKIIQILIKCTTL